MIDIQFDLSEFERKAKQLHAAIDQVPFALALAMTEAATITKQALVEEWPKHVHERNRNFIGAALRVKPATKRDLSVEIYDRLGRAHLELHADGGSIEARGNFAIPVESNVKRGAHGVPKRKRPRSLSNAFVADLHGKGPALWVRWGAKGRKLRLMYVFRRATPVPKDMPFRETFSAIMRKELRESFPAALARAMKTRRPR